MEFLKEHLRQHHYKWNDDGVSSIYTDSPSRRTFNVVNGDQVLFIINHYASLQPSFTTEEGRKMEDWLLNDLPFEAKSEISVFHCMRNAF